jgi:hypothetical protein
MNIPIDSRNCLAKMLLSFFDFETIHMAVNTSSFFNGGNPPAHPIGATSQLFV